MEASCTPDPCDVPTVGDQGFGKWNGADCVSGGTVASGVSCSIVAAEGYTCVSPGQCFAGTFAAVSSCVQNAVFDDADVLKGAVGEYCGGAAAAEAKYGPIGSVKIMWPREDEDLRLRTQLSGFVAFMTRS